MMNDRRSLYLAMAFYYFVLGFGPILYALIAFAVVPPALRLAVANREPENTEEEVIEDTVDEGDIEGDIVDAFVEMVDLDDALDFDEGYFAILETLLAGHTPSELASDALDRLLLAVENLLINLQLVSILAHLPTLEWPVWLNDAFAWLGIINIKALGDAIYGWFEPHVTKSVSTEYVGLAVLAAFLLPIYPVLVFLLAGIWQPQNTRDAATGSWSPPRIELRHFWKGSTGLYRKSMQVLLRCFSLGLSAMVVVYSSFEFRPWAASMPLSLLFPLSALPIAALAIPIVALKRSRRYRRLLDSGLNAANRATSCISRWIDRITGSISRQIDRITSFISETFETLHNLISRPAATPSVLGGLETLRNVFTTATGSAATVTLPSSEAESGADLQSNSAASPSTLPSRNTTQSVVLALNVPDPTSSDEGNDEGVRFQLMPAVRNSLATGAFSSFAGISINSIVALIFALTVFEWNERIPPQIVLTLLIALFPLATAVGIAVGGLLVDTAAGSGIVLGFFVMVTVYPACLLVVLVSILSIVYVGRSIGLMLVERNESRLIFQRVLCAIKNRTIMLLLFLFYTPIVRVYVEILVLHHLPESIKGHGMIWYCFDPSFGAHVTFTNVTGDPPSCVRAVNYAIVSLAWFMFTLVAIGMPVGVAFAARDVERERKARDYQTSEESDVEVLTPGEGNQTTLEIEEIVGESVSRGTGGASIGDSVDAFGDFVGSAESDDGAEIHLAGVSESSEGRELASLEHIEDEVGTAIKVADTPLMLHLCGRIKIVTNYASAASLTDRYRPLYFWWKSIQLVERLSFVLVSTILADDATACVAALLAVSSISCVASIIARPHIGDPLSLGTCTLKWLREDDFAEILSKTALVVNCGVGLALSQGTISSNMASAILVVIVIISVAGVIAVQNLAILAQTYGPLFGALLSWVKRDLFTQTRQFLLGCINSIPSVHKLAALTGAGIIRLKATLSGALGSFWGGIKDFSVVGALQSCTTRVATSVTNFLKGDRLSKAVRRFYTNIRGLCEGLVNLFKGDRISKAARNLCRGIVVFVKGDRLTRALQSFWQCVVELAQGDSVSTAVRRACTSAKAMVSEFSFRKCIEAIGAVVKTTFVYFCGVIAFFCGVIAKLVHGLSVLQKATMSVLQKATIRAWDAIKLAAEFVGSRLHRGMEILGGVDLSKALTWAFSYVVAFSSAFAYFLIGIGYFLGCILSGIVYSLKPDEEYHYIPIIFWIILFPIVPFETFDYIPIICWIFYYIAIAFRSFILEWLCPVLALLPALLWEVLFKPVLWTFPRFLVNVLTCGTCWDRAVENSDCCAMGVGCVADGCLGLAPILMQVRERESESFQGDLES